MGTGVQALPFQWKAFVASPTAHASLFVLVQTSNRVWDVPLDIFRQDRPSHWTVLPFSPTAQPVPGTALTARRLSDVTALNPFQAVPFQCTIVPLAPTAQTSSGAA